MSITKEDWKDYGKMARNIGIAAAVFLLIAVLGSSTKASWLTIPVGTGLVSAGAWFAAKDASKKDRISTVLRWGGLTLLFTVLAVVCS